MRSPTKSKLLSSQAAVSPVGVSAPFEAQQLKRHQVVPFSKGRISFLGTAHAQISQVSSVSIDTLWSVFVMI
jgi:hypothetical protein